VNVREIRQLNDDALLDAIEDQREALFNLRFQNASGQLEDPNLIKAARHDLARLLTVKRERELAAQLQGGRNG
jgi:large subunit ribosomal protein L29